MPFVLMVVLVLAACVPAQEAGASGWEVLFDGTSTKSFRGFLQKEFPKKGWSVEDGTLRVHARGGGGDIVTDKEYADFELRFEWKVAAGANSGVMYRAAEREGGSWLTASEYQVLDDALHGDGKNPKTSAAAMYGLISATGKALSPVGSWNEARIVAIGPIIEHWLNGTRVVRCDFSSDEFRTLVKGSKFAKLEDFAKLKSGRFCFQDHGDDVWYRNIRVRTFQPSQAIRLFDGKTWTGWTHYLNDGGKLENTWSITEDGTIVCTGNPAGYIRTTTDHSNFILRLDWRFSPVTKKAGNSGVLFRQVGEDKVWPRSIEAQLMSENAGDFWNIGDFKMTTDPSRTNGRNTKKLAMNENPVGEWNSYEIEVDGGRIELRVNGKVLNVATDAEVLPGKICLQSEGAEIHFRNITLLPIAGENLGYTPKD